MDLGLAGKTALVLGAALYQMAAKAQNRSARASCITSAEIRVDGGPIRSI